jgi:hypothetical protein
MEIRQGWFELHQLDREYVNEIEESIYKKKYFKVLMSKNFA